MSQYSHLYKTKRWQRLRAAHLAGEPLCVMCKARGRTEPARVADHIRPHRGDMALFLDPSNLQSLCFVHHNKDKQQEEWTADNVSPVDGNGYKLDGSW